MQLEKLRLTLTQLEKLLREGVIYESITALRTRSEGCVYTPLGVRRLGRLIEARVYPGRRLIDSQLEDYALITFPSSLLAFAELVLEKRVELVDLGLECPVPRDAYLVVEARVAEDKHIGGYRLLRFEPLAAYVTGTPEPFTRLASCLLELLILYTRLQHRECSEIVKAFEGLRTCIELLERRGVEPYRGFYVKALEGVRRRLEECRLGAARVQR